MTRVFLVQEFEAECKAISEAVTARGYKVKGTTLAIEALDWLYGNAMEIDIVSAALRMEQSTSFELLRESGMHRHWTQCHLSSAVCTPVDSPYPLPTV